MDAAGINDLLTELKRAQALAQGQKPVATVEDSNAPRVDFAQVLDGALRQVSAQSAEARQQAERFSSGDPNVNLHDVMIDLEKASLSFNQMVQVRNRLVSAYQDIMNMPV